MYIVDFETMLQQRQYDPSRKRQVKRDLATTPKKGVAGLRIDGITTEHGHSSNSSTPPLSQLPQPLFSTANNLISTIAATDAAIRIASDIIDSTLAHADEYRNSNAASSGHTVADRSGISPNQTSSSRSSTYSNASTSRSELLHEVEETLNISNGSSNSSKSPHIDFFSSTIDEFRSLALTNIAESSSDDSETEDK